MEEEAKEEVAGKEELAIITGVMYGKSDRGVGLTFSVKTLDGDTVLFLDNAAIHNILNDNNITNINFLTNKPCVVRVSDGVVYFSHLL